MKSRATSELLESGEFADAIAAGEANQLDSSNQAIVQQSRSLIIRRMFSTVLLVLLFDWLLLCGISDSQQSSTSFFGWALFLFSAATCLLIGIKPVHVGRALILVALGMVISALRLCWQGNALVVIAGWLQIVVFALVLHQVSIRFSTIVTMMFLMIPNALIDLMEQIVPAFQLENRSESVSAFANIAIPAIVCLTFASMFVVANPDVIETISDWAGLAIDHLVNWLVTKDPATPIAWVFCGAIAIGLMAPSVKRFLLSEGRLAASEETSEKSPRTNSYWYVPARNTLLCVNLLYLCYLSYEFTSFWFRQLPEGFYYAGYAHRGAAWLTIALGVSTIVLSMMFRPKMIGDPRVERLQRWAWLWSVQNFLLGIAVVNRMWIYIDFNGLTRMRIIGIFGISCVLAGLALVVFKIRKRRSFSWLVEAQFWTLVLTVYLASLTPLDFIAHQFNVNRISAGHLAPVVQMTEHPVSSEGWIVVSELVHSKDPIIRVGILAMMLEQLSDDVEQAETAESSRFTARDTIPNKQSPKSWRQFQGSTWVAEKRAQQLLTELSSNSAMVTIVNKLQTDPKYRKTAIEKLRAYAYQWY